MVNSKIDMIQLFFLAILGGLIGSLFGFYVSHIKYKYNILNYKEIEYNWNVFFEIIKNKIFCR